MNASPVYIEIGQTSLKVLRGDAGLDMPLERAATGRLTLACREKLVASLQQFLDRKPWQPQPTAFCAIGANGVSLRRLSLPAAAKEELPRLLRLQIENEFPLSPEELAWGWCSVSPGGTAAKQEILVAAVRREMISDYAETLAAAGLKAVFTLGALARAALVPVPTSSFALLHVNGAQAELLVCDEGVPAAVRVLGLAALADAMVKNLGNSWTGRKIFLSGAGSELGAQLSERLGTGVAIETLVTESGVGRSVAIQGLKQLATEHNGALPITLRIEVKPSVGKFALAAPETRLWAIRAAVLLCALLVLPYAEALILKPFLSRKLTTLKAEKSRLETIDRELDFLQSLKQTQPPYLDVVYLFAKFAPQGSKIDSVIMNRRGEVQLRGSMRDATQVGEFRSKLIGCGFFSAITVEEQAPGSGKLNVRLSAQWKPPEQRAGLTNGPTTAEIEKAKSGGSKSSGAMPSGGSSAGAMPAGALPPGLPPEVLKQLQAAQPR
ncbi:MAG: Type pilus assembly protein PilM [Verrucomicrobiota bacterium]|jgi:hypothetical protein